jgi:hypothetical protein
MSDLICNIWDFETRRFRVSVDALVEYSPDLSWDETGEVATKVDNGELVSFCARASVTSKETGEALSSHYLGGCIYESYGAFREHDIYFSNMVRTVCDDARYEIAVRAAAYSKGA